MEEQKKRFKNIREIGRVVKNCVIGTRTRNENGNVVITKEALNWKGKVVVKKPDGTYEEADCASVKRLLIGVAEVIGIGTVLVIAGGATSNALNNGNNDEELPAIEDGNTNEETPIE